MFPCQSLEVLAFLIYVKVPASPRELMTLEASIYYRFAKDIAIEMFSFSFFPFIFIRWRLIILQ